MNAIIPRMNHFFVVRIADSRGAVELAQQAKHLSLLFKSQFFIS